MAILNGPRVAAKSGDAKQLILLLHGYGADGNDLAGLAGPMGEHLPDATFIAPNAPDRCAMSPVGYQWFPISWIDGTPEAEMKAGFLRAAETLNAYLDEVMQTEGVTEAETALIGFSQGTMMSLHVGPRRERELAGIVGFSGRLAEPDLLEGEIRSRPPVLLTHGDMDEVIPVAALQEAQDGLAAADIPVRSHVSRGIGHGIAPDALGLAVGFLKERFGG